MKTLNLKNLKNDGSGNEELFSLADDLPTPPAPNIPKETPKVVVERKEDQITQLGGEHNYQIKNIKTTSTPSAPKKHNNLLPNFLFTVLGVLAAIILIVSIVVLTRRNKEPQQTFIFKTLESKFFTMNYNPDYVLDSVVDKRVPFTEKHILKNTSDGEKNMSIIIKDVKFNYDLSENSLVKIKREDKNLYKEEEYDLRGKKGLYFKKTNENFEHTIVLIDRNRSIIYEILFTSSNKLADDANLQNELTNMLNSITFL